MCKQIYTIEFEMSLEDHIPFILDDVGVQELRRFLKELDRTEEDA